MKEHHSERLSLVAAGRARRRSVAFVGVDGVFESTQAAMLRARLKIEGKPVLLIHPLGAKKSLAYLPDDLSNLTTAASTGRLSTLAGLLGIGASTLAAYALTYVLARVRNCEVWLVSDRSLDDLLISHRRGNTLSRRVLELARRLTPVPETTVWLQTPLTFAIARDREFNTTYYEELHAAYTSAAAAYSWQVVPADGCSPMQVLAEVERLLRLPVEPRYALPVGDDAGGLGQSGRMH